MPATPHHKQVVPSCFGRGLASCWPPHKCFAGVSPFAPVRLHDASSTCAPHTVARRSSIGVRCARSTERAPHRAGLVGIFRRALRHRPAQIGHRPARIEQRRRRALGVAHERRRRKQRVEICREVRACLRRKKGVDRQRADLGDRRLENHRQQHVERRAVSAQQALLSEHRQQRVLFCCARDRQRARSVAARARSRR